MFFASGASLYWNDNSPTTGVWTVDPDRANSPSGSIGFVADQNHVNLIKSNASYTISSSVNVNTAQIDFIGYAGVVAELDFTGYTLTVFDTSLYLSGDHTGSLKLLGGTFDFSTINMSGSTLMLNAPNLISSLDNINYLGTGTLALNGDQTLKTVYLSGFDGNLDMGSIAATMILSQGDFTTLSSYTLYISNCTEGSDHVYFLGGTCGNFSSTGIKINGMRTQFDSGTFEVTPLPEPSTYGSILGGLMLVGTCILRRSQKRKTSTQSELKR